MATLPNWWEGNTFRIPGLPVRPTYAPALAQPGMDASPAAGILQQLGFQVPVGGGIGEMQGAVTDASNKFSGSPNSPNAGYGPGREARNLGDFVGSAAKGIGMATGPLGFATGMTSIAGPTPITGYGWSDVLPGGGFGLFDSPPLDANPPNIADIDTGYSYGDLGNAASGGFAGTDGPGSYGGLAKGGTVMPRHLVGPNPPGPDDGFAKLQLGEEVIPRRAAKQLKAKHGEGLFGMLRQGRVPR